MSLMTRFSHLFRRPTDLLALLAVASLALNCSSDDLDDGPEGSGGGAGERPSSSAGGRSAGGSRPSGDSGGRSSGGEGGGGLGGEAGAGTGDATGGVSASAGGRPSSESGGATSSGGRGVDDTGGSGSGGEPDSGSGGAAPQLRPFLPCDVERIFVESCRMCHSAATLDQEPFFETWGQVNGERSSIVDVLSDDYMPYGLPPLTNEQKATVFDWIDAGAPPVQAESKPQCPVP